MTFPSRYGIDLWWRGLFCFSLGIDQDRDPAINDKHLITCDPFRGVDENLPIVRMVVGTFVVAQGVSYDASFWVLGSPHGGMAGSGLGTDAGFCEDADLGGAFW